MVKVYASALVIGVVGLVVIVLGGAIADGSDRPERDPGNLLGVGGKTIVAIALGFGMGGISAEFSPLGFTWQVSLAIAVAAAAVSAGWVRYAVGRSESG